MSAADRAPAGVSVLRAGNVSRPYLAAGRAFPDSSPHDQLCRDAIQGLAEAREWAGLAVAELDSALETAWSDLGEVRTLGEDFDRFSARSTAYALENASRFFDRSADQCVETWIALAELRDFAERLKKRPKTGTHG